jgi:hypothetical protein
MFNFHLAEALVTLKENNFESNEANFVSLNELDGLIFLT